MILRGGYQAVAFKLQEAADAGDSLGANDIRTRLSDCIRDNFRGSGTWAYYVDHFGDGESGDVIYSANSDMLRAPYSITSGDGSSAKCAIEFDSAMSVVPRTVYEIEADEADHYAAMEESLKTAKLYTALPLYERFISKDERSKASADDFAGKGKSFPILKPGDVMAAVHAMGRAGSDNSSAAILKRRIIAIAKRKGWEKYLPKSWRSESSTSEADPTLPVAPGTLALRESCAFAADLRIAEAFSPSKKIKLIAPGKGSTAYYTAEALQKAAVDRVFKAGTPMRIDHPTMAEESARPEGSVRDWGAVLARDAEWIPDHPEGPGLYSEVKPFSDHAVYFEEKAPYAGVSIRANGFALTENGKTVLREGVPVLKEFTSAEGVDMVTRAGAGGMFLSEAAIPAAIPNQEGGAMDAAELQKLQESLATQTAVNARLLERAIRGDAEKLANATLKPLTLHEAVKGEVVSNVLKGALPMKDGELDSATFVGLVNAEAKRLGELASALTGSGRVSGMGTSAPVQIDAKEAERVLAEAKKVRESAVRNFREAFGMPKEAAEAAADRMIGEVA